MKDEPKNLWHHILALREVLIRSIFSIIIGMIICYTFIDKILLFVLASVFDVLEKINYDTNLIFTSITEFFSVQLKLSFYFSLILFFPYIIYQVWKFVEPALLENERKIVLKIILLSPILFFIGILFAFYIAVPMVVSSLVNESQNIAVFLPKISENVSFIIIVLFSFGISFQLPLIIYVLDRLKILSIRSVRKLWREVIIAVIVISAIVTPPDAFSMVLLAIPLILIYFLSILICGNRRW